MLRSKWQVLCLERSQLEKAWWIFTKSTSHIPPTALSPAPSKKWPSVWQKESAAAQGLGDREPPDVAPSQRKTSLLSKSPWCEAHLHLHSSADPVSFGGCHMPSPAASICSGFSSTTFGCTRSNLYFKKKNLLTYI